MSAIVCQGLQSCLEPGFLEPHAIIDKLATPRSNVSQSIPWSRKQQEQKDNSWNQNKNLISNKFGFDDDGEKQSNNDGNLCWNFIQALSNTNTNQSGKEADEEEVYVHPLAKRSSSTLSTQSLEMCTENLGSETGSNSDEIMADLSCLSCEVQSSRQGIQRSRSREYFTKKQERHGSFPPPLTLISGSDGIQLRPHREGGRLVLRAVAFCQRSCFQAERIDGRLRLFTMSKDGYTSSDEEISQYDEDEKKIEELGHEHENAAEEQDSRLQDTDAYASDAGDIENTYSEEEGFHGSGGKLECGTETEEFPIPSRCKEEGPRNSGLNWEPSFWVAIS